MKKLLSAFFILTILSPHVFGYSIKVYDYMGNRVGTYKKEGDNYVLYDFYDKKVENPEDLIKNPPDKKTLTEYSQFFYDENMIPLGFCSTGIWTNNGRYYPRGRFFPRGFYPKQPYIVRPQAKTTIYEEKYPYGRVKSIVK